MGNAFQDQFLKAGLIDDKKVKQAKKEEYRAQKQGKKKTSVDENRLAIEQAKTEQIRRDRELNRKRQEEIAQKAQLAQVRQMIENSRLLRGEGDSPYNFSDKGRVKRIYVTQEQQSQISRGRLAIVKLDEQYELIPAAVAEKIRQRDPSSLILLCEPSAQPSSEDDPYAAFKVPDDLMW